MKTEEDLMDAVYDELYRLTKAGQFKEIDSYIRAIDVDKQPLSVLLSVLTFTCLPEIKKNLKERKSFYYKVKELCVKSNETDLEGLFIGLEEKITPGDMFVCKTPEDIAVEWLCVRDHPDDDELKLFLPMDDFPIRGGCDVDLSEILKRPMIARCGLSVWQDKPPVEFIVVGTLPYEGLKLVRNKLADLARGHITEDIETNRIHYEEWLYSMEKVFNNFAMR